MSQESLNKPIEQEKGLESEMEELRALNSKRELLQQRWSKLLEKIEGIQSRYPDEAQLDEQGNYMEDRSFLNAEDRKEFLIFENEMEKIVAQRNELDKEILGKRFEIGLNYLSDINKKENIKWKMISNPHKASVHEQTSRHLYDIVREKIWEANVENNIAQLTMVRERILPLPPSEIQVSFLIVPKLATRKDRELAPGLDLSKRFGTPDNKQDRVEVHAPLSESAHAFPDIKEEDRKRAEAEMLTLARALKIENL